jgi:hypothetical protein
LSPLFGIDDSLASAAGRFPEIVGLPLLESVQTGSRGSVQGRGSISCVIRTQNSNVAARTRWMGKKAEESAALQESS